MLHTATALRAALLPALEESARLGGTAGPDLTRYFAVCGTLLAVIGLLGWGFRRLVAGNLRVRAEKRSLRVLDVLPLGGKRRLAVVRCYDRTFVLGLGDHEVTPITELDPVIGADEPNSPTSKADRTAFAQALQEVRKAMPGPRLVTKALGEEKRPTKLVRKKVRRKKVKVPVAAAAVSEPTATATAPPNDPAAETVAEVARRMVRERQGKGPSPRAPFPSERPAPASRSLPVERLEGVLG